MGKGHSRTGGGVQKKKIRKGGGPAVWQARGHTASAVPPGETDGPPGNPPPEAVQPGGRRFGCMSRREREGLAAQPRKPTKQGRTLGVGHGNRRPRAVVVAGKVTPDRGTAVRGRLGRVGARIQGAWCTGSVGRARRTLHGPRGPFQGAPLWPWVRAPRWLHAHGARCAATPESSGTRITNDILREREN